jgi:[ribosomal protein S5]-alanine N-acetyltransferase
VHVLDTGRLTLRWLEPGDAGFILELTNDPDWLRHIGDRGIRSLDDAGRYIVDGPRAMYDRLGFGLYCVELRGTGTAIGLCGLLKRDWLEDVDIGFAFLPAFRGRGYAFEAAAATLRHGRERLGLDRITAIVSPANADSVRLLEKLGLNFERMVLPPDEATAIALYALRSRLERSPGQHSPDDAKPPGMR